MSATLTGLKQLFTTVTDEAPSGQQEQLKDDLQTLSQREIKAVIQLVNCASNRQYLMMKNLL